MSMLKAPRSLAVIAVCAALAAALALPSLALAHENRQVGPFKMTVGWADEPPYVGFKNAVQLLVKDRSGKAVADLGDALKVEVIFGSQQTGPLPLIGSDETPGEYLAPIIPTRPGNYTFHFVGSIKNQKVDQSFTSSEQTFDPVAEAADVEFPAKDPSRAELALRLDRLTPRIDAAQSAAHDAGAAASQSRILGILGVILGAVGLVVGIAAMRRGANNE